MSLPTRVRSSRMTDGTLAVNIDDGLGAAEQALSDILGIPIDTDISAALLTVLAAGLQTVNFADLGADPTVTRRLGCNFNVLKFHDGVAARQLFMGKLVRKTVTESRSSGTTLTADAELVLPLAANDPWTAEFWIYTDAHASADLKFTLAGPVGITGIWGGFWVDEATGVVIDRCTTLLDGTFVGVTPGKGDGRILHLWADVLNGGTPGNLEFQWARNSASNSAAVLAGSLIRATKR